MKTGPPEHLIKRILVAIDASPHSRAALEAAAALAASVGAELVGLYVEDEILLLTADLPFSREVRRFPAALEPSSSQAVERQLRAQARRVELLLRAAARQAGISWSFRTARGNVKASLLAAAEDADLITLGRMGFSSRRQIRIGSTALAMLREATRPVMIIEHGVRLRPSVVVVYDASEAADRALHLAARITRLARYPALTVLPAGDRVEADREIESRAAEVLAPYGVRVAYRPLGRLSLLEIASLIERSGDGLLILPGSVLSKSGDDRLEFLLASTPCPLILVQ